VADRTVRAIFEARVTGAQKGMRDLGKDVDKAGKQVDTLSKDLTALDKQKVAPSVDVQIDDAKNRLTDLKVRLAELKTLDASPEVDADIVEAKAKIREVQGEIRELNGQKAEVRVNASIDDAQRRLQAITAELGELRTLEVTPEVSADITAARRRLADVKAELRDLSGAKAVMQVTADTDQARSAIDDLADEVGDAGTEGGEEAGENIATGILDALRTIPIAGAIIGVGVAIAGGILLGIQQGLSIEAERDLFGAQTGLDEDTSARFGRAAGEAYANAWGDSVAANLSTARLALQAGIIDTTATDAEVENVIAKVQGLSDAFDYDIATSIRGVGNLLKTGMVKDIDEAFDLLVFGAQKVETQTGDLIEVFAESSATLKQFGLDAQTSIGLFSQAIAAGAPSAEFLVSALEELAGNAGDSIDIFDSLGLSGKDMAARLTGGGEEAAKGLDMLLDALREIEDPAERTVALVALFGEEATAMQEALLAIDLSTAVDELGGIDSAVGAADRALKTMADNTATRMEEAKRNVELAMDGIKGALAEAFGDEISGAAEWVSMNRAPLLQFFRDVVNGAFDMADAFTQFGATGLEVIAELAVGFATLLDAIPTFIFDGEAAADGLRTMAEGARDAAETLRTDVPDALDEVRDKTNAWLAPEIMKARIHDATLAMTADLEGFVAAAGESDIDVKINGDTVNAEEALAVLVANINAEDGTVTINGESVPAEDALDRLLELIEQGEADVTVGADTGPADVSLTRYKGRVSASEAAITVNASTSAAEAELDRLARDRYVTIFASTRVSTGGGGAHEGGWIAKGLHAGGKVPGRDPGYDNVLWPLNSGGRTLVQPLAGGEYVVNSRDATFWGPMLEWMNGGGRPSQVFNETSNAPVYIDKVVGLTIAEVEREAATRRRRDALSPSKGA
jgi:predicted  nucleic acid-binding Zn-ribbon protein/phosphotransferase system HPr-like phosphotransfer protein